MNRTRASATRRRVVGGPLDNVANVKSTVNLFANLEKTILSHGDIAIGKPVALSPMQFEGSKVVEFDENTKRARVHKEPGLDWAKLSQDGIQIAFERMQQELRNYRAEEVASVSAFPNWADIDDENEKAGIIFELPKYTRSIFKLLKFAEKGTKLEDNPFVRHDDLNNSVRAVIVDWLVVLQDSYELNHETLYLAVKIIDQYLAHTKKKINRDMFHLVATVSVFLAAKVEERMPPPMSELLFACENAFTPAQFLQMEVEICRAIGFKLLIPLSYTFLRRFAKSLKLPMDILTLARFILEVSLMHTEFSSEYESFVAAGALRLALLTSGLPVWTAVHEHHVGYKVDELAPLCRRLQAALSMAHKPRISAIKDKYSHEVFFKVATRITPSPQEISFYTKTE